MEVPPSSHGELIRQSLRTDQQKTAYFQNEAVVLRLAHFNNSFPLRPPHRAFDLPEAQGNATPDGDTSSPVFSGALGDMLGIAELLVAVGDFSRRQKP